MLRPIAGMVPATNVSDGAASKTGSCLSSAQRFKLFNELQGKLRVSVTHSCQLQCKFCHQEGIEQHWKSVSISPELFGRLVKAYRHLGGEFVELTGGEPTLHPEIGRLLEIAHSAGAYSILCTNGLMLDRAMKQIKEEKVDLIRLSLHATDSSEASKALLGNHWSFDRLRGHVELALGLGVDVQLIFTHSGKNTKYLEKVLELALQWNVNLQVVDLIATRVHHPASELGYVTGEEGQRIIASRAHLEREVRDRTGAVLKLYRTPSGKVWEVKDFHFGLLHSGMCEGCSLRQDCGEGIYALRVDALGVVKPCLLRDDLQKILTPDSEPGTIEQVLDERLQLMLSGVLTWN